MTSHYTLHAHEADTVHADVVPNTGWLQIAVQPHERGGRSGVTLFANPTGRAVVLAALCRDLATSVSGGKDVSDALLAAVEARATALPDWADRAYDLLAGIVGRRFEGALAADDHEQRDPITWWIGGDWITRIRCSEHPDFGATGKRASTIAIAIANHRLATHPAPVATEVTAEIAPSAVTWEWHCNLCDDTEEGFTTGEAAESCLQQHVGGVHPGELQPKDGIAPLIGSIHSSDGLTHVSVPA